MTKQELFDQLCTQLDAADLYFGHAVIDEEDEAMMVLMKVLGESVEDILSSGDTQVEADSVDWACKLIEYRIQSRKPMAYILKEVHFAGLKFQINENALVPRSPIAELILNGFKGLLDINKVHSALDLCTGSGCIGLALAHYHPKVHVELSDISPPALDLARDNIQNLNLESRVKAIESDLFTNLVSSYDLILSNPPYVSQTEYQDLPEEYKQEPKLGLVTELNGLRIPIQIMAESVQHLNPEGHLILEVGYSDETLQRALPAVDFQWLSFQHGGQGVCIFSRKELLEYQAEFENYLESNHVV